MAVVAKLKAALTKIAKRLSARREELALAERKGKRLNREIKALREKLDSFVTSHKKTLEELQRAKKPSRIEELRAAAKRQEAAITKLIYQIDHKVRKRREWREKARKTRKRIAWWVRRQTSVKKQLAAAKKKWEEEHGAPVFETWMLNGCPGNVDEKLKPVIAFQVVACSQYVTATTNGTHTPSSLHYPWNASDNEGHAVDTGASTVSSMQSAAERTKDQFGAAYFRELFSPCGWWLKYGTQYAGYFPGHGNHGHYGVY